MHAGGGFDPFIGRYTCKDIPTMLLRAVNGKVFGI